VRPAPELLTEVLELLAEYEDKCSCHGDKQGRCATCLGVFALEDELNSSSTWRPELGGEERPNCSPGHEGCKFCEDYKAIAGKYPDLGCPDGHGV